MQIKINDKVHILTQVMLSNNYLYITTSTDKIVLEYEKTVYAEYAYKSLLYYMKQKNRTELLENANVRYILKTCSTFYTISSEKEIKRYCKKCHVLLKDPNNNYCFNCGMPLKDPA